MTSLFIDYETICLNCQERGYSFGYSFKTIEYNGKTILDSPCSNLNGLYFQAKYNNKQIDIRNLTNAHTGTEDAQNPVFVMINAKHGSKKTMISRFTYEYRFYKNPNIVLTEEDKKYEKPRLLIYLDSYIFPKKGYVLLFYSFKNMSKTPLKDVNYFQIYDFDIYGEKKFGNDIAKFDPEKQIGYQYDSEKGEQKGLIAGIGAAIEVPANYYDANQPDIILSTIENFNLTNSKQCGPTDCALAMQWHLDKMEPERLYIFPLLIVAGEGKEDFDKNVEEGKKHLTKIMKTIPRIIKEKTRHQQDPKLKEMSFSMRQWCVPQ